MEISHNGLNLIKREEQLRLRAYLCPAGKLTIGYGHTGKDVYQRQVITAEQAEILLRGDTARFMACVNKYVRVKLTQNQFDALVSFCFNVGEEAFRTSTLLAIVNRDPNSSGVRNQLERWVHGTINGEKVRLAGLIARREREADLYESK